MENISLPVAYRVRHCRFEIIRAFAGPAARDDERGFGKKAKRTLTGLQAIDIARCADSKAGVLDVEQGIWSEWRDSNPRPLVPQTSALTGLRYTPTRLL